MSDPIERVRRAFAAYKRAERRLEQTRAELHAAIRDALDADVRQVDLVRVTGYTRERIRQIRGPRPQESED